MRGQGLVLTNQGALDLVNALRTGGSPAAWLTSLRIGLFANDWRPERTSTISEVQPAWFSGNTVLHFMPVWEPAYLDGDLAVTNCVVRIWTHNGGPISSWVFGYYVINVAGQLIMAERTEENGIIMGWASQQYRVTPQFAQASRYPE